MANLVFQSKQSYVRSCEPSTPVILIKNTSIAFTAVLTHLRTLCYRCPPHAFPTSIDEISKHADEAREYVRQTFETLRERLEEGAENADFGSKLLRLAGLWPTISPQTLLKTLSRDVRGSCNSWMEEITQYGEAIALSQRAKRLCRAMDAEDVLSFFKEAENPGRQGWCPAKYPDWLLLEVENDICIRGIQATVALAMMSEDTGNAVFQLNMGEGKSSVIIPMIAAASADGSKLLRVLVLRSLLNQTHSLMTERLGRLIGRRVYNMPFTRHTPVDVAAVKNIHQLCLDCMEGAGVLVTLPENVLSFRLMGFERMLEDGDLSKELLKADLWLQKNCKDVLDESDKILNVKFQLVYAVGAQLAIHGSPGRWSICLAVLSLVGKYATIVAREHPYALNTTATNGSYPLLRFYEQKGYDLLLPMVLHQVVQAGLPQLSFVTCSETVRAAVLEFVSKPEVSREAVDAVEATFVGTMKMEAVLFLRGLFAHGVLQYALSKRWYVDYGLDLSRCRMAVPYRARGHPSPSAEFSHPDVAIVLTSLSYYYTGLAPTQLREAFTLLQKDGDAMDEYSSWCRTAPGMPIRLRTLMAVNLDDEQLCEDLFPRLQRNAAAIEFFLKKVVFPREAKEFQWKLSTSAWDIPATAGGHVTTGFSGTNDNQRLLPLSIVQYEVGGLEHTNAMVLTTILQERNRQYRCVCDVFHRNPSSDAFLSLISSQEDPFQVLIDVGAQILDLTNFEVAKTWLTTAEYAEAAVYFDESHVARVVDREGVTQNLSTSIFHDRLGECLIYLDEAHARGIDLALPDRYRAAVYLGPETSKDKLMQGK